MNPNQQEPLPQPNLSEATINYEAPANIENKNIAPLPAAQEKASSTPVIQSVPPNPVTTADNTIIDSTATKQAASSGNIQTTANDLTADDGDLIEKEWVDRAKTVVEKNKDNPHAQNKEMNEVKKDYLKKRYNKDLVVEDE